MNTIDKVNEIVELMLENIDGYAVDLLEDKNIDVSSCEVKIEKFIKATLPYLVISANEMVNKEPEDELDNLDGSYVREYLPFDDMERLFYKIFD